MALAENAIENGVELQCAVRSLHELRLQSTCYMSPSTVENHPATHRWMLRDETCPCNVMPAWPCGCDISAVFLAGCQAMAFKTELPSWVPRTAWRDLRWDLSVKSILVHSMRPRWLPMLFATFENVTELEVVRAQGIRRKTRAGMGYCCEERSLQMLLRGTRPWNDCGRKCGIHEVDKLETVTHDLRRRLWLNHGSRTRRRRTRMD